MANFAPVKLTNLTVMTNDFMNYKFIGPEDPALVLGELDKGTTAVFSIDKFNQVTEAMKDLGDSDRFVMTTLPEAFSILVKKI